MHVHVAPWDQGAAFIIPSPAELLCWLSGDLSGLASAHLCLCFSPLEHNRAHLLGEVSIPCLSAAANQAACWSAYLSLSSRDAVYACSPPTTPACVWCSRLEQHQARLWGLTEQLSTLLAQLPHHHWHLTPEQNAQVRPDRPAESKSSSWRVLGLIMVQFLPLVGPDDGPGCKLQMADLCLLSLTPPGMGASLLACCSKAHMGTQPARWQQGEGALLRAGTAVPVGGQHSGSHKEHIPAKVQKHCGSTAEALLLTGTALTAGSLSSGLASHRIPPLSALCSPHIMRAQQVPGEPSCLQAPHCRREEHSPRPCSTGVPQSPGQKPGQLLQQLLYALALHRYSAAISQQLCKLQEARSQLLHFVRAGQGCWASAVLRVLVLQQ